MLQVTISSGKFSLGCVPPSHPFGHFFSEELVVVSEEEEDFLLHPTFSNVIVNNDKLKMQKISIMSSKINVRGQHLFFNVMEVNELKR